MQVTARKLTGFAILGLLALMVASCGQQVCVMGIGKCSVPEVKKPLSTQSDPAATQGVKINCPVQTVYTGNGIPCNVSSTNKGVSPYLFELLVNGSVVGSGTGGYGTLSPSGTYGTATSTTYTAPNPVNKAFTVEIRVTDSGTNPTSDSSAISVKP